MIIETKYNPGQIVYIVVTVNVDGKNASKVIASRIQSEDLVVTIKAAISGCKLTYNCIVDRRDVGTVVNGMPFEYTVQRLEEEIYETQQDCLNSLIVKQRH